jgi:biotin-(acetyl-CoA carboxylase) ligase
VLEPDEPLAAARRVFYAGMVALGDALAARAPPEKPIVVEWPDAVYVDGGLVGGGRLAWPDDADEHAAPDWLVFGAAIRIFSLSPERSGLHPLSTALADESFDDVSSERLVEGFARHLMVAIDRWQEAGFAPIAREYIAKLKPDSGVHRDLS